MAAAGAHHLQMALADLTGDVLQLGDAQPVQLIRMRQLAEMHATGLQWGSAYVSHLSRWRRITPSAAGRHEPAIGLGTLRP